MARKINVNAFPIGIALVAVFTAAFLLLDRDQPLLSNVHASSTALTPNGDGRADDVTLNYTIGEPSRVSVFIEKQDGERFTLRNNVPRMPASEPYTLLFDGSVRNVRLEDPVREMVLPDGMYRYVVQAKAENGGATSEYSGTIQIRDALTKVPMIHDLTVTPSFSPDEDAIDDVAYFTYRLPVTATVTINLTGSRSETIPFITDVEEGPYAQSHVWDGKEPNGTLVSSGTYTYTVTARDHVGNVVQRQGQIEVDRAGRSEARVTFVHIAPVEVAFGDLISVTVRVKNTGHVRIRTQGPPSGFSYTTDDLYSSIEEHRWKDKGGGFWRVGLDWGGGHAYPFRWALSSKPPQNWAKPNEWDYLEPGQEVEITGSVRIEQREDRMDFYVGLVHEGVGYPVNNVGRTLVCVSIPGAEGRCPRGGQ